MMINLLQDAVIAIREDSQGFNQAIQQQCLEVNAKIPTSPPYSRDDPDSVKQGPETTKSPLQWQDEKQYWWELNLASKTACILSILLNPRRTSKNEERCR
eukprot:554013-Ditylum_brightwellii.AAC.1